MTRPAKVHDEGVPIIKAASGIVRSISSDELMAGRRMIVIHHGTDDYKLQITSAGKFILTK